MAAKNIHRWFVLSALLMALLAVPGVAPAADGDPNGDANGWCENGNHYGLDCDDPVEPPADDSPPPADDDPPPPPPPADEEPTADGDEEPEETTPPHDEGPAPSPSHQNGHTKKHKHKKKHDEAPPAVSIDPPSAPDLSEQSPSEAAPESAPKAPSEPAVDPVASGAGLTDLGGDALRVTAAGSAPTFALRAGHRGLRVRLPRATYRMGAWLRSRTPGMTVCLRIKEVDPTASAPFRVRTHEKCVETSGSWQRVRLVLRGVLRGHQLLFSLYVYGAEPGDSFDAGNFRITRRAPHRWHSVASVRA